MRNIPRSIPQREITDCPEGGSKGAISVHDDCYCPKWSLDGFETRKVSLDRKAALCRILLTGGKQARDLAEVLAVCETGDRCGLSICPFCMRRFRARFLIPETCSKIAEWQERTGYTGVAVSAVPGQMKLAPGELHKLDLAKMRDAFRQQLRRAGYGNCIAVAGVDLSFNEHSEGLWAPHWQPHLYAVVLTANSTKQVKAKLGKFFQSDDSVHVPVRAMSLRDLMPAVSYLWKPFFQRRVSYIAANGRLAARKLPLRPDQVREVALFFGEKAPTERLLFMGLRRRGQHLVEV